MPTPHDGCAEYRELSRRQFLGGALAGGTVLAVGPAWLPKLGLASRRAAGERDVLVYIFLRGGIDGLSLVPPYGEDAYYTWRPTLGVAPPGAAGGALDLDGFFGLLPAAAPLLPAYKEGRLAFVHAVGVGEFNFSHFEAFKSVEFGCADASAAVQEGWLARHLQLVPPVAPGPLRAAALTDTLPLTLQGAPQTLPVADPASFVFPGDPATAAARKATLTSMYAGTAAPLGPAALDTLGTLEMLEGVDFDTPALHGAEYPDTDLGRSLKACATMVREQLPVEVLMIDVPGFDHHSAQGPLDGKLALLADELARALAAFDLDLGPADMQRVTLLAHSEFGRRVQENASAGTDHGYGNVLLALGGHVAGGQVLGSWPGLAATQIYYGCVNATTDLRSLQAEVLVKRCGALPEQLKTIFPGHLPGFIGLIA